MFTEPRFQSEEAAREHLESVRWPDGAVCPHCGGTERNSRIIAQTKKGARPGLWFCGDCRTQFTVTVGTLFERSKVPLHKWLITNHLMCASKKGVSAHQIHRMLDVTYKTAWFMCHRIREAMVTTPESPMGSGGGIVEADETYWSNSNRSKAAKATKKREGRFNPGDKQKIIALVERNGNVRGFHVASVNGATLKAVLRNNVAKDAHLMTDDNHMYRAVGREFASHQTVNHTNKEYARGNVTTNTVEGFFSILKRGLIGTFHHVSPKHLGRYVDEFSFKYNNRTSLGFTDDQRAESALKGISGKRLTYRRTQGAPTAA